MKIGPYEIQTLETGRFALDGGAMFGVVPKVLWSQHYPADELNRITMALRVLLLRSEEHVVLIDTGLGDKFSEKQAQMYGMEPGSGSLLLALEQAGLRPEEITDVILTHLHFDHAGGATRREGENLVPTFPQARYWVQQRNWDWANHPSEKDRASYLKENFQPLHEAGVLHFLDGESEILPGIFAWVSDGHTVGQQLIRVQDPQTALIYCADIIPMAAHLRLPYIMGYDLYPMTTLEEKRRILERACAEGWILVFEHDPRVAACRVNVGAKGAQIAEELRF